MASSSKARTVRQQKYRTAKRRRVRDHLRGPTDAPAPPAEPAGRGGRIDFQGSTDEVNDASEASFPASDPPSYTPNTSIGPPETQDS